MRADPHGNRVRRFYELNTLVFRRFGHGRTAIRRAVWGPEVADRESAFHHVDDMILERLPAGTGRPKVLDIGCGLGATLAYLAARRQITGEGITFSPSQSRAAAKELRRLVPDAEIRIRSGDFTRMPDDISGVDVACAIEAFVHGSDPGAFFRGAVRALDNRGILIVCDDFRTEGTVRGKRAVRSVREFRHGWRLGSLLTVGEATDLARDAGLALFEDIDLTGFLEIGRPRDVVIDAVAPLLRLFEPRYELAAALLGGSALQRCLRTGLVAYRFLVFRCPSP